MSADLLRGAGQVAGIGGVALGVLLLVFREIIHKNIFPKFKDERLAYRLLRLMVITVWSVAVLGIVAWVLPPRPGPATSSVVTNTTIIDKVIVQLGQKDLTPDQQARLKQAVSFINAQQYDKAQPLIDELVRETHPAGIDQVPSLIENASSNAAKSVEDMLKHGPAVQPQPTGSTEPKKDSTGSAAQRR